MQTQRRWKTFMPSPSKAHSGRIGEGDERKPNDIQEEWMLGPWFDLSLRCAEIQQVMILRSMKILAGGAVGEREARRMVSEKAAAAVETMVNAALGERPDGLVRAYRSKVLANRRRLSKRSR